MITYRDMTFCAASCATMDCHRRLTDEVRADATDFGLPLAMADFSLTCPEYAEIRADILREGCGE